MQTFTNKIIKKSTGAVLQNLGKVSQIYLNINIKASLELITATKANINVSKKSCNV